MQALSNISRLNLFKQCFFRRPHQRVHRPNPCYNSNSFKFFTSTSDEAGYLPQQPNNKANAITLNNGRKMPLIGLGTWLLLEEDAKSAVNWALEAGYRHIDTAFLYENEVVIGRVLKDWLQSGRVKREDLFITTKLPFIGNRPEKVGPFLKKSLSNLKLDYVDLYLIHLPVGFMGEDDNDLYPEDENKKVILDMSTDLTALWKTMEAQVDSGKTKAIGLANFNNRQITKIVENARIRPANVQVEVHAYFQQKSLRSLCQNYGISVCGYGPLGSKGSVDFYVQLGAKPPPIPAVLDDPVVLRLAQTYSKTPAQILLRHLTQQNVVVIPKSASKNRIQENIEIFDFALSDHELDELDQLDRNSRCFVFDEFNGLKDHPEYPFHDH